MPLHSIISATRQQFRKASHKKMQLLTIENAKTTKGEELGYLTGILYLAPHTQSGVMNVCKFASPECARLCLYTAGMGIFKNVQDARKRKTQIFASDPVNFVEVLACDIEALQRKAKRLGLKPAVRLNGTSDISWESFGGEKKINLMNRFPSVPFYDYTKNPSRAYASATGKLPSNYTLTFSLSEKNRSQAIKLAANGVNIAAVFSIAKKQELPLFTTALNVELPVINGDDHDLRFLDPKGCVVGLRAKGKARNTSSSFILTN